MNKLVTFLCFALAASAFVADAAIMTSNKLNYRVDPSLVQRAMSNGRIAAARKRGEPLVSMPAAVKPVLRSGHSSVPVVDDCVLGGGASGAAAAAMLKDKGHSVIVFEKQGQLGGHCDTYDFTCPPGQDICHVELGAQGYFNTSYLNENGLGVWVMADFVAWVERFAGPGSAVTLAADFTVLNVDMDAGVIVNPAFNLTAFEIALTNAFTIGFTYPCLNTAFCTDPVPAALLQNFRDFALANELVAMYDVINLFAYKAGVGHGNYSDILALDVMIGMSPAGLQIAVGPPTAVFGLKHGCQTYYDGIAAYLGSSNIYLNAELTRVHRRGGHRVSKVIGNVAGHPFKYKCRNVFVAFPPVGSAADVLSLDSQERHLFNHLSVRNYYAGAVNVSGPIADNHAFIVTNEDLSSIFNIKAGSATVTIGRSLNYGPAQTQSTATTALSAAAMQAISNTNLHNIPHSQLNTTNILTFFSHDLYSPFFDTTRLSDPTNSPYQELEDLQGHKNTYWISSVATEASTTQIVNNVVRLLSIYFP